MVSMGQAKVDLKKFNLVAEQVEQLKKTDLALSLKQLTIYEDILSALTVEQNLVYFKLLAEIQIEQNKYSNAKRTANKGLIMAKRLASPSIVISEILYLKGFAFESLGDIPQATKEYKKGLEVAESLHSKVQVAAGLINLGAIAYLTDDFKRSLVLLNDAYNIAKQTDDDEIKGLVNTELGIVYAHLLQDEQSMIFYQQSYAHFKKAGMLLAAHNSLQNIAVMHVYSKDYQKAISVFETIISESNKDSPSDSMYTAYSGLSWAHLRKEESNPDAAYEYLLMSKPYLQNTERIDYELDYYYAEAYILNKLERFEETLDSIAKLERITTNHQEMSLIKKQNYVSLFGLKASVYYQQKQFLRAYQAKSKEISLTDKMYENEDNRSITQVRLKLEAEQADKKNKILHSQEVMHRANLRGVKLEHEEQRVYLIISALITLAIAWVLVKLIQSQRKLKIASNIDALTGVANRRSLMKKLEESLKLSQRSGACLSVLLIDVDNFKDINDALGHSAGDNVLIKIAELGAGIMRKNDLFGRFGGKEFMVYLPNTPLSSALEIGEKIRHSINDYSWPFNEPKSVSVSIGVASLKNGSDLIQLIKCVDEQLYQAKASGRNKVCG
jgi:diguanylate cyclase (GGDEF)-like protein